MPPSLRILIVAEVQEGWSFGACREALAAMGHRVEIYNLGEVTFPMARSLLWRAVNKLSTAAMVRRINRGLRRFLDRSGFRPDLILFCKGERILPETLKLLKRQSGALLFNWQTDDYFSPTLSSPHAIRSIPLYDCIFAHTPANVPELLKRGARRAEYLPHGADSSLYHPIDQEPPEPFETDVLFIGNWRRERQRFLEELAAAELPFRFAVRGGQWERLPARSPLRRHVRFGQVPWKEYGRSFRRAKISLVFLVHFDTGRVIVPLRLFEIAAAGGFMLVEKDRGQAEEFFKDKEEMALFTDVQDLKSKIAYYLSRDEERRGIARAAQQRMVKSGHFYTNRMERVLQTYEALRVSLKGLSG